jgi:hypothetical protein
MGVDVTDVVDHDWAKSIYSRTRTASARVPLLHTHQTTTMRGWHRFELSVRRLGLEDPDALRSRKGARAESDTEVLVKT